MNSYFASYLKHNGNPDITPEDTSFLMPCIFMVQYCVATIGVKLGEKFGARFSAILGLIIIYISIIMMIIFTNYYAILMAMGIFGLGDGLQVLSVINNSWKYFPEHSALVSGIILTGLGISSGILTPIGDYLIINPEKKEPENGIYPQDIANNLKNYLYFLLILFFFLKLIAIIFTFNYEKKISEENDNNSNEPAIIETNGKELQIVNTSKDNFSLLCEGLLSEKNFFLLLFCFCSPCKYIII